MAATITSLMTGESYKRSAELASVVGPYNGYARNADAHKRVMRKHQAANDAVRSMHGEDRSVHALATKAISIGDEFLPSHYDRKPVMPSTLVLEAVTQVAGWLYIVTSNFAIRTGDSAPREVRPSPHNHWRKSARRHFRRASARHVIRRSEPQGPVRTHARC